MQIRSRLSHLVRALRQRRRGAAFACGDCHRNAQCGAAPSRQCVVRAAQIASGRRRPPRRETFVAW